MKVLIAGGAGFIGSHLIDFLLEEGHEVICVDNLSLGVAKNIEHLENHANFRFYKLDLIETDILSDIIYKEKIEYVFHLAANSDIQASADNPEIEYRNTYSTTFSILESMRRNDIKYMFFASTSAVYGDKKGILLKEDTTNLIPISYYGAAKLGCEALLNAYSYMNDMSVLVFRFANVVGPRLTHGVIYDFIRKLRSNQNVLEILGDGNQTKPYIYISDLINGINLLMDKKEKGLNIYNIGVESSTSVTRIADILCEEMGIDGVKYQYTGGSEGWKGDVPEFQYCLSKIHKKEWKANYTSDEAIRLTIKSNI